MKLQEAKDIKLGSTSASKVMLGNTQVWPNQDNNHLLYGEVLDPSQPLPTITLDNTVNTPKLDAASNMFYLDTWSNAAPTRISFDNKINIKSINKLQLDTSNVTGMRYMFDGCRSLTSLDLSSFNTSNVTDMYKMFNSCRSLTTLDLSNFNTSKVTTVQEMFSGCTSLTSLNLSDLNMKKLQNLSHMFYDCSSLTDVFISQEVTLNMLTNNLSKGDISYIPKTATIHYNGVEYKWQTGKWTISNSNVPVLYGEVVDTSKALPTITLNNEVNTPKLYASFNIFHLDTWSNASPTSILINNKSNIKSLNKMQLDTSNITDMSNLFNGCSSLTTLDLSKWNISNVTNMQNMFLGCSSLKDVYVTSEATLKKLTNNLKSQGGDYIPKTATIHYNGEPYTWFHNAWAVHIIIES